MADNAPTPNYNFNLPLVGGDDNVWGDLLNENWSSIDTILWTVSGVANAALTQTAGDARYLRLNGGTVGPAALIVNGPSSFTNYAQFTGQFVSSGGATFGTAQVFFNSPVTFSADALMVTPAASDNSQRAATTAWVTTAIGARGFIADAPSDGQQYARRNAAWSPFVSGPPTTISDTAPSSPSPGQLWWDSVGAQLYVWYQDPTSSQWVVAVNQGGAYLPLTGGSLSGDLQGTTAEFSGAVTALTPTAGDSSARVATTAFVAGAISGTIKSVKVQTFSASGTYTPSLGMAYCLIELVGGGGGGGGTLNPASGLICMGGAAGSGGYSRRLVTAAQVGASQVVTIGAGGAGGVAAANAVGGAGGNTSVGSLCVANGSPGAAAMGSSVANYVLNGTPGANTTGAVGDLVVPGNAGASGVGFGTVPMAASGTGGASFFGGGGPGRTAANSAVAGAAGVMGSGGGGAASANFTTNGAAGGAGGAGYVVITEYCTV